MEWGGIGYYNMKQIIKAGDRIILLTKKYNAEDTRKGFEEFGIKHIELVITGMCHFVFELV